MKILFTIIIVGLLSACSAPDASPKLPKGRCLVNEDCPPGFRCLERFCEDIYHPRREIRTY